MDGAHHPGVEGQRGDAAPDAGDARELSGRDDAHTRRSADAGQQRVDHLAHPAGLDGVEGPAGPETGGFPGGGALQGARMEQRHPHLAAQGGGHRGGSPGVDLGAHRRDEARVEGGAVVGPRGLLERAAQQVVRLVEDTGVALAAPGVAGLRRRAARLVPRQGGREPAEVDREVDVVHEPPVDRHRRAVNLAQAVAHQITDPVGDVAHVGGVGRRAGAVARERRRDAGVLAVDLQQAHADVQPAPVHAQGAEAATDAGAGQHQLHVPAAAQRRVGRDQGCDRAAHDDEGATGHGAPDS